MGICASCLGLNRHPSQDGDLDRILDSSQPSYGAFEDQGIAHPDAEDIRREREALDQITAQASAHMIDVLHPTHPDYDENPPEAAGQMNQFQDNTLDSTPEAEQDAQEAAWLESVQAAGSDTVKTSKRAPLTTGLSMLR